MTLTLGHHEFEEVSLCDPQRVCTPVQSGYHGVGGRGQIADSTYTVLEVLHRMYYMKRHLYIKCYQRIFFVRSFQNSLNTKL